MWARNVLFLGICAAGLWAFAASVFPRADRVERPQAPLDERSIADTVRSVDSELESVWETQRLTPAPAADELTIARRLSLALVGTIPSLEEIRRFESLPDGSRVQTLLAERLADRRYSDYIAERLARAYVGVDDGPFLLFRRRRFVSWLADQLAAGTPYNRLVQQLVSDVGLWTDTPSTNFVTITIKPDADRGPDPNQLAARVSRAFLGVRIDCAECHDHPFDSWKQADFQGLAAFFGGTRHSLRGIRDVPGKFEVENRQTGETMKVDPDVPFAKQLLFDAGKRTQRERLARWVTHPDNPTFARAAANRAWAIMFGRPLVDPIDNIPIFGSATDQPTIRVLDILGDDFVQHGYDLRRLLAIIASTRAFSLASRGSAELDAEDTARHEAAWAVFPLTRLRPEQVVGGLLQSGRLATIDASSHILVRFARAIGQNEFIERYGDGGAEEFEAHGGTIPQRLLLMNGKLVTEKTKDAILTNASTQIAALTDDPRAVETAMLAVLTRRPSDDERRYFVSRLADKNGPARNQRLGDLYWTLLNSTEFSWNH